MKSILLAAAAFVAVPAIAQDTPQTTPPSAQPAPTDPAATPADSAAPADPAAPDASTAPADPATTAPTTQAPAPMPAPTTGDATAAPMGTAPMGAPATGTTPAGTETSGGYQPSAPALATPAQPGQTVRVQPSASPSEAFPPPAAQESYPICKKGQYDGCMQASDARRGGKKARRR